VEQRKIRVPPLPEAEWSDEQRELLIRGDPPRVLNIFSTLIRHVDLYRAFMRFGAHMLRHNTLQPQWRELVILRIGYLCRCAYEFHQHARIGRQVGLTEADIEAVRAGPGATHWSAAQRALLQATDELHAQQCISDATWAELEQSLDEKKRIDLVFTAGQYTLVSMALNTLGVQIEEVERGR